MSRCAVSESAAAMRAYAAHRRRLAGGLLVRVGWLTRHGERLAYEVARAHRELAAIVAEARENDPRVPHAEELLARLEADERGAAREAGWSLGMAWRHLEIAAENEADAAWLDVSAESIRARLGLPRRMMAEARGVAL